MGIYLKEKGPSLWKVHRVEELGKESMWKKSKEAQNRQWLIILQLKIQ